MPTHRQTWTAEDDRRLLELQYPSARGRLV